jgi:hypothetical protein
MQDRRGVKATFGFNANILAAKIAEGRMIRTVKNLKGEFKEVLKRVKDLKDEVAYDIKTDNFLIEPVKVSL